jgi:hypothetical protein
MLFELVVTVELEFALDSTGGLARKIKTVHSASAPAAANRIVFLMRTIN